MYITHGRYPMYRRGVPDVHQGGESTMYIREGGTRCTLGRGVPDVHDLFVIYL